MRIAIVLPNLRFGGAERSSLDLALALKEMGCDIQFYLMDAVGEFLPEALESFTVRDMKASRLRHLPFVLARLLRRSRPDALIANMWPLTCVCSLGLGLARVKCKLLLVEHCSLSLHYSAKGYIHRLFRSLSIKVTYPFATACAAVSEGVAEEIAVAMGRNPDEVAVLGNPIPLKRRSDHTSYEAVENLWNCPPDRRILAVGRLKEEKNYSLLLLAFSYLSSKTATLMIVGEGQSESILRELASELGISNRVVFVGFQADVTPFYATASLLALSSDYEGFGSVIVEAMSFGVPVVATDCPYGPREILGGGRWGRLAPIGDAVSLARAIDQTLLESADRDALKLRAADFSPEIVARNYLRLLQAL